MKNSKMLLLLLLGIQGAKIQAESNFDDKMKSIADKLHDSAYKTADWLQYYADATSHNLSDWVENCKRKTKHNAQNFKDFIIDETDATIQNLSKAEQETIRELNRFYTKMASATRDKQNKLIRRFSRRWEQCQKIFEKISRETHHGSKSSQDKLKHLTQNLHDSNQGSADWCAYYAQACRLSLNEWVDYYRNLQVGNDNKIFEYFIINEWSPTFKNLTPEQQEIIEDFNELFYELSSISNKENQDELVRSFSNRWNECQQIFESKK